MKRWLFAWGGLILAPLLWAQEAAPSVEVAPSPVVKYPNPADVLNKTNPAPKAATTPVPANSDAPPVTPAATPASASSDVASTAPAVTPDNTPAATPDSPPPAPATPTAPTPAADAATDSTATSSATATSPSPPAPAPVTPPPASGWVWRWIVKGAEADVRSWADQLSPQAQLRALGSDSWEVTIAVEEFDPTTSTVPNAKKASLLRP